MDKKIKILLAILGLLVSSIVVLFIVIPSKIRTSKIKPKAQIREKISSEAKQIKQTKINTKDAETIIKKIEDFAEDKTEVSHVVSEPDVNNEDEEELDKDEEIEKAEVDLDKEGEGFEKIETEEDLWFWNEDMIKRWNKEKEEFTYYWVEIEWRKLWREKEGYNKKYFLDGKEMPSQEARKLKSRGFNSFVIYFIAPPTWALRISKDKPDFEVNDKPFVKNGKNFTFQKRGKYYPKFGNITALAFDDKAEELWFALKPILSSKVEAGGANINPMESTFEYIVSKEPPIQLGLLQLDIHNNKYIQHNHKNGLPYFKKYQEGEEIKERGALKHATVKQIGVLSNIVEIFTDPSQKRKAYFDQRDNKWYSE